MPFICLCHVLSTVRDVPIREFIEVVGLGYPSRTLLV